jgi:AcrR family transcriptional regulator
MALDSTLPDRAQTGVRAETRKRKRAHILATARAQVLAQGFEAVSLREVARAAACSPAGLYEFFASKEDLLDELRRETAQALAAALARSAHRGKDPTGRVVEMGLAYVRFARKHPEDFCLLFGGPSRRRTLADGVPKGSLYDQIREGVIAVVGMNRLHRADPRAHEGLAYGFWATVHGMAMLRTTVLRGFRADFDLASRVVLETQVAGWRAVFGEAP